MQNRLKEIRKNKGLTQTDIGKIIGVSDIEIGRKEKGKTPLKDTQIIELCKSLNVSADYLLGLKNG